MSPMQFQVVGVSTYDFTADNGQRLAGTKFHVIRPFRNSGPSKVGNEATSFTVPATAIQSCGMPDIGVIYDAVYDPQGKLYRYQRAKAEGRS